jgi:hypothetical protein
VPQEIAINMKVTTLRLALIQWTRAFLLVERRENRRREYGNRGKDRKGYR